ncbi:MAG: hypothetical protein CMM60_02725 [Rhodospirillaceae bacterium]|jgi:hypothetical protein|nr:hypothetical protein [Rhodospirillaceae bacterium]|tara:strand:- start:2112 stop:2306 length:195 start_codon:yes stop_codon:yes gene_type:complete
MLVGSISSPYIEPQKRPWLVPAVVNAAQLYTMHRRIALQLSHKTTIKDIRAWMKGDPVRVLNAE